MPGGVVDGNLIAVHDADLDFGLTDNEILFGDSDGSLDQDPNLLWNGTEFTMYNFVFDADQAVGAGQDNYVLTYDDGTGLISLELNTSNTFGTQDQIPFMNAAGTDFEYDSGFLFSDLLGARILSVTGPDSGSVVVSGTNPGSLASVGLVNNDNDWVIQANVANLLVTPTTADAVYKVTDLAVADIWQIDTSTGALTWDNYGTGAITAGAATFDLQVDANGNVIEVAIGGGGLSVGTEDQIPVTNNVPDDFDYTANFMFNSTAGLLTIVDAAGVNGNMFLNTDSTSVPVVTGSGTRNIGIGHNAGIALTTSDNNILIGWSAGGTMATNSDENVMIGYQAGQTSISGAGFCTFVGSNAGYGQDGDFCTAVGYKAMYNPTTPGAQNKVAIGRQAFETGGSQDSIAIGAYAGRNSGGGNISTVLIGTYAGDYCTGLGNTALGHEAFENLVGTPRTGTYGVAIGYQAGQLNDTSDYPVYIGYQAGNLNGANYHIGIGYQALQNSAGTYSVAIGYLSGRSAATQSTFVGAWSGEGSGGSTETGIGSSALRYTSGGRNTALGASTFTNSVGTPRTAGYGVAIGYQAGRVDATGENAIHIGREAGENNTEDNVITIGYKAGENNTVANSASIGQSAQATLANQFCVGTTYTSALLGTYLLDIDQAVGAGVDNYVLTYDDGTGYISLEAAGGALSVGTDNQIPHVNSVPDDFDYTDNFRFNQGLLISDGNTNPNIYINTQTPIRPAGLGASAEDNICIGEEAGGFITTGDRNICIGLDAGRVLGSDTDNVFVGHLSGASSTGSFNTHIGTEAGWDQDGNYNVAVGYKALYNPSVGSATYRIAIGSECMETAGNTGSVAIGYRVNQTQGGQYSIGIGYTCAVAKQGDYSISMGHQTAWNATGAETIYIGRDAGQSATTSDNAIFLGTNAGFYNQAIQNIGIGEQTFENLVGTPRTGTYGVAIGYQAAQLDATGDYVVSIGYQAGLANTADDLVAIGKSAGAANTGTMCTFVGAEAGKVQTSGINNTFIGWNSGVASTTGDYITAVGSQAGAYATVDNITAVGYNAGRFTSGIGNTSIGVSTFENTFGTQRSGTYGVAVGFEAGKTDAAEDYVVHIGYQAGTANTFDNVTNIGQSAQADAANQFCVSDTYTTAKFRNYKFNIDQTVGAGQDGYHMTYNNSSGEIELVDPNVGSHEHKSYTLQSGGSGTYYLAGYYEAAAADANLTQASTTQTFGSANQAYAAHAFIVAGGAGTASGGAGAVTITVTGTSITDLGVRTAADTETIVADITTMLTDDYYETTKKWLGTITFTLDVGATGHTAYAADFNYGLAKYEDFDNQDFTLSDIEVVGKAGAADTGFNIEILHHDDNNWTYSAAAFVPGGTVVADMNTDHGTEQNLVNGQPFAWKRTNLATAVTGTGLEGVIYRITTGANNAVDIANAHIGVTYT